MPDYQTLGLFIAAMLAGIVCFRLYWILGRRTGHEPPPQPQPRVLNPAQPQQGPEPQPASSANLMDIQLADRNFDTQKFLAGAREAYNQIVTAFARGDTAALARLVSPEVLTAFEGAIRARTQSPASLSKLNEARILGAALHGRQAEITVAFNAEFANGANVQFVSDVWTFSRNIDSQNPNWILIATSGDQPG